MVGEDFPLVSGEGYIVSMTSPVTSWRPVTNAFYFVPDSIVIRQGATGAALDLKLALPAPAGGITAFLASNNASLLTVPPAVTFAEGTSVATIALTPLLTNGYENTTVTVTSSNGTLGKGNATVQILPPAPTVNLAPSVGTFSAAEFFKIYVSLSDPAPVGGLVVTLAANPAGVLQMPTTITVPYGAVSAEVWAKGTAPGSMVVSAVASGYVTGQTSKLTIVPCITTDYGPVTSSSVGVMVPMAVAPTSVTYSPITSLPVGIAVGSVITGIVPNHGALGDTGIMVRVAGRGLATATGLSFFPADGITIREGSFSAATDGTSVQVMIDLAESAAITTRTVLLAGVDAPPAVPSANQFQVTLKLPVLASITPITREAGATFSLTLRGRNFDGASSVQFMPSDGVQVNNPPSVSADGTIATVTVILSPTVSLGQRAVTITAPGGTSPVELSAKNTFTITALPGEEYPSLVSLPVGVVVPMAVPPTSVTYSPITSVPVGIAVGSVITGTVPNHGALGDTGLMVRVTGRGLATATGLSFFPADGITIRDGSFFAATDGTSVHVVIDIAETSATTARTVLLAGVNVLPAVPSANQFQVTLKLPELASISPITREAGATFSLTLRGRNFGGASLVQFMPSDGVQVNNPPSVSADGTIATVTVILSPTAPLGQRAVTITAPGGTSPVELSATNTFTITALPGEQYTSLVSPPVGVVVPSTAPNTAVQFGPVIANPIGVYVTPPPQPPTTATFTPVMALPVGIVVGTTISGLLPKTMEPGTTTTITVSGSGLDAVTGATFLPGGATTISSVIPASDGRSLTFSVTADANAFRGRRTLVLQTASGTVTPAAAGANVFLVGPKPQIAWIDPILKSANSVFNLTITGVNFQEADAVSFVGVGGIQANNPPVVSTDGTSATVKVIIDGGAPCGQRGVVISSPYGSSDAALTAKNTFTICEGAVVPP